MANIIDEVSKETIQKLESIPSRLWQLFKALKQINDWNEQRKRADLKEIKDNYFDKLKELEKIEKELNNSYKKLYDKAMETKDFSVILPETYQDLKALQDIDYTQAELKAYFFNAINGDFQNNDLKVFLSEYVNEYEDLTYNEITNEKGDIKIKDLIKMTDFEEEVLNPMIEEIQKEQEQSKNKIAEVKEAIFGTDTRDALENCSGLLWNDPDQETIEEWLNTPFDNEKWEVKNGLEIAVGCWFDNVCETELTSEEREKAIDLIVDDIYNYHEIQHHKREQLEVILNTNPMRDDYHTGIRKLEDIKTFEEAIQDDESFCWCDFSKEQAEERLKSGWITLYSSKPFENGNFVSTSYNQARDYAGNGKVYERTTNIENVAWINGDEGVFTDIKEYKQTKEKENLLNNILKDEKATVPTSHFDNEIDIDER